MITNESATPTKPLLISFSGIDGAGKSTQISRLTQAFEREGLRVLLITFWDEVIALKSVREEMGHKVFRGDKGVGSPEAPIRRRDKDVKSPVLTLFRMGLYFLDALSLRRLVARVCRKNALADVVIFDRYIYDELANLSLNRLFSRLYVRTMLLLIPKPDVPMVLDADPDAAFARKPEYPLAFLHSNRNAYLHLARMAGMVVIAPAPIDQAHAEVLQCIQQMYSASSGAAVATVASIPEILT